MPATRQTDTPWALDFRRRVRRLRDARKLSQLRAAQGVATDQNRIKRIENGHRRYLTLDDGLLLTQVFAIPWSVLFNWRQGPLVGEAPPIDIDWDRLVRRNLRRIRTEKGVGTPTLSALAGTSDNPVAQSKIVRIESGEAQWLHLPLLHQLATALEVPLLALFDGEADTI